MATTLLKGGIIVDVLRDALFEDDVLIDGEKIVAVGDVDPSLLKEDTRVVDVQGKFLCPGFIDGHIHIESTLMTPAELAKVCAAHGTSTIVADPHEIANVCGVAGITYMIEASKKLPVEVLFALPSCVPASPFDESGATLTAADLRPFYQYPGVVALGEVMDYPAVLAQQPDLMEKLADAKEAGRVINGHAPGLLGADLTYYIAAGINDDHECSTVKEARERIAQGIWVMIREGSAARNLEALMPLFDAEYNRHCLLVTDDKHADDLLEQGHIDAIIRKAVALGADPLVAIRMATIQAAECFKLADRGAVEAGYRADIVVLDSLEEVSVSGCWHKGVQVYDSERVDTELAADFAQSYTNDVPPTVAMTLEAAVRNTFHLTPLQPEDFLIDAGDVASKACHVIAVEPGSLITQHEIRQLNFTESNDINPAEGIAKIAVCERHKHTGHIGLGFISGLGLRRGAIASSVSHDSHNLIVVGTNEADMALAANTVISLGGGRAAVAEGHVLATQALPIAGLMSDKSAAEVAAESAALDKAINQLGCAEGIDPIMNMAFSSLTVIPHIKMTTFGPFDVDTQQVISVFAE